MPPLLFEAAFHLDLDELRHNLLPIVTLAVPGVLITTLIIGGITALGIGLPLGVAMVFGALLSATDPVSVVAFFRQLGAPRQLASIVEGESLFNDGTAVVVFRIALAIAVSRQFSLVGSVTNFLWLAAGGLVVGGLLGWVVSKLIARVDDYLIETTLTTILAYGAYLAAERLHVSGVLAVVAAGLVNGNIGPAGMSPTTRIVIFNFWEYVAFVANSLVFLLIGLDINVQRIVANWSAIVWAIARRAGEPRGGGVCACRGSYTGLTVPRRCPTGMCSFGAGCAARSAWPWCSACSAIFLSATYWP